MRVTTTVDELTQALGQVRYAIPTQSPLIAHTGVLLLVEEHRFVVVGSDGDLTIAGSAVSSGRHTGRVLTAPKPLLGFLETAGGGQRVDLDGTGDDLEVTVEGRNPYRFRQMDGTFPLPPSNLESHPADLVNLGDAVRAVRHAADRAAPGVQLLSGDHGLYLHTTDNYRLARATLPGGGFGPFSGVVPLAALERVAPHQVTEVAADPTGQLLQFRGPTVTVTTRLLSTPFPPVDGLLGQLPENSTELCKDQTRAALAPLGALADRTPLTVTLDADRLCLAVANTERGAGEEQVPISPGVSAPFSFSMRHQFLADAIDAHPHHTVGLHWTSPTDAIYTTSSGDVPVTLAAMPVR